MSEWSDIREAHVEEGGHCAQCMVAVPYEFPERVQWPCDAARFRDALDKALASRDAYFDVAVARQDERNAARALADELAEVGEAVLAQAEHFTTGTLWDYELDRLRAALAKWEASHVE